MGYCMVYDSDKKQRESRSGSGTRILLMTIGFLMAFVMTVNRLWPAGRTLLQNVLLPGDSEVSGQALSELTENLREGLSVAEAVEAFCRDILENAQNTKSPGLPD